MLSDHKTRPFEIVGTCVNEHWLPIRENGQVFLLSLKDQKEKHLFLATAEQVKCILGLPKHGLLVVMYDIEKNLTCLYKVDVSEACKCGPLKPFVECAGAVSCEVSPDGNWLQLAGNYLIDLKRLIAIKLNLPKPISFISSQHVCVLETNNAGLSSSVKSPWLPVYSLASFAAANPSNPLGDILGYLPFKGNFKIPFQINLSSDAKWISMQDQWREQEDQWWLRIYSVEDGFLTLKRSFEFISDRAEWLADNTILFRVGRNTKHMAGIYQYNPDKNELTQHIECNEAQFVVQNKKQIVINSPYGLQIKEVKSTDAEQDVASSCVTKIAIANSLAPIEELNAIQYARSTLNYAATGIPFVGKFFSSTKLSNTQIKQLHAKLVSLVKEGPGEKTYGKSIADILDQCGIMEAQLKSHAVLRLQVESICALDKTLINSWVAHTVCSINRKKGCVLQ